MKAVFSTLCFLLVGLLSKANNVQITNVSTTVTGGTTVLNFNISWDNSWRGGPANNWDAVWVFVKYRTDMGWFSHLDLTGNDVTAPSGLIVTVPADHKGCFVYRSTDGAGSVTSSTISIGITQKPGTVDLKVFGLEMVNIPTGSFYLGYSGGNNGNFGEGGTGGATPFQITSASTPTIGTGLGQLYDGRVAGTANFASGWPNGYNSFYIMKYELSQAGYRDFMNTLPGYSSTYLGERADTVTFTVGTRIYKASATPATYRNNLKIASTSGGDLIGADANGNNIFNEANDGEWTAANFLYWSDAAAFLDWAALRPMTEFEYEKAANGPVASNYPAYASGTYYVIPNVTLSSPAGIINPNTSSETVTHDLANNWINTNEFWGSLAPPNNPGRPLRGGFVADATSTRLSSGGSYYGVMELSGNLWEPVVTSANVAGRSFNGSLGDGVLSAIFGRANETTWPGNQDVVTTANTGGEITKFSTAGISKKGGGFDEVLYSAIYTTNYDPAATPYPTNNRLATRAYGCRGVR